MATPVISIDELQHFVPLRGFNKSVLKNICRQLRTEHLKKKQRLGALDSVAQEVPFLVQGRVRQLAPDKPECVVTEQSVEAKFPLYSTENRVVESVTLIPSWVIWIPKKLLEKSGIGIRPKQSCRVTAGDVNDRVLAGFYQALHSGNLSLPGFPDLAARLSQVMNDPETSIGDVSRVIQLDPALAARIIHVANSPAYGGFVTTYTLKNAVSRLGLPATRNLATSFILKELFQSDSAVLAQEMKQLWQHSARVAAVSFVLASLTPGLDPEQALLAGLMHDIGKLPLLHTASKYPELLKSTAQLDHVLHDLRAEIGALVLRKWDFPEAFVTVALEAEHWQRDESEKPDYTDIVLIAQLHCYAGTKERCGLPMMSDLPAFKKLALGKLSPKMSIAIVDKAQQKIDNLEGILMG